ncbi:MAG: mitochondral 37S ribosomal protein S27 [Candelina submexicana]|nr:MAG: mitochondral 37S ribosomal protein S27 [Candelina submexicana]
MAVARSRILDLVKVQCRIFSTIYNPEGIRTGNKVLRQRLRGPALAAYYPRRVVTFKDLKNAYPNLETWDDDEEDRLEHIQIMKSRGKGAPKKRRTAAESKKFAKKKKPAVTAPKSPTF